MQAGEAAGGDKRGKQSAALLIHDGEEFRSTICALTTTPTRCAELARLEARQPRALGAFPALDAEPAATGPASPTGASSRSDRAIARGGL